MSAFCPSQPLPEEFEEGLSTGAASLSLPDPNPFLLARPLLWDHQLLSRARGKQVKNPCQDSGAVLKLPYCRSAILGHHRCPIIHKPECCVFFEHDSRVEYEQIPITDRPFGTPL